MPPEVSRDFMQIPPEDLVYPDRVGNMPISATEKVGKELVGLLLIDTDDGTLPLAMTERTAYAVVVNCLHVLYRRVPRELADAEIAEMLKTMLQMSARDDN